MVDKKYIFVIAVIIVLIGAGGYLVLGQRGPSLDLPVLYTNPQYGFTFSLPASWQGFSIVTDQWEGFIAGQFETSVVERGPVIAIRNPLWTDKAPQQDIPIMAFNLSQWDALRRKEFYLNGASVLPTELGRNANYVFAIPVNFDGAHSTGWEEVEKILRNKPLHNF